MKWIYPEDGGCWYCSICGNAVQDFDDEEYPPNEFGYNFCPYCGEEIDDVGGEARMIPMGETTKHLECGRCHQPVDPGDRFCRKCGRRFAG